MLQQIYEDYKDQGLMVLGVGVNQSQGQCQAWINTHGLTHPVLVDAGGAVYNLFGNGYVPYNSIMSCEQVVLLTDSGFNETLVRNTIEAALVDVVTINHTPQGDTEDTGVPIPISAEIIAQSAFVSGYPQLSWRADGGAWSTLSMTNTGGDFYAAEIPGQMSGTDVDYYMEVQQTDGCSRTYPAPGEFYSFFVGPDTTLPVINHSYQAQYAAAQLPLVISADVTDNLGVESVSLEYQINGGGFNTIPMTTSNAMYAATIPETLVIGDIVEYRIYAVDSSAAGNSIYDPTSGYYATEIIDQIPAVVIDLDGAANSGPAIRTAIENNVGSAVYTTSMPVSLGIYQSAFVCLGVYGSGNHQLSGAEGDALAAFMDAGGCVYMEGGDTWYYDTQTSAHPYFHINAISDGNADAGPEENGLTGSIADGMNMNYNTGSSYNNWIDRINPGSGALAVLENSSPVYNTVVSYDGGTYKTVGSSIKFGGLSDGNTHVQDYMDAILTFFGVGSSQPTPTPTPDCINHGDVTLDGDITAGDAQLAFLITLGSHTPTYEEECAADCNGDGEVTAGDAQAIFLVALGSSPSCADPL